MHRLNGLSTDAIRELGGIGLDGNWLARAGFTTEFGEGAAEQVRTNASDHGFDFGEFRHATSGGDGGSPNVPFVLIVAPGVALEKHNLGDRRKSS